VAKLKVSDGVVLIKLSLLQKCLLGRPYIAFELSRIISVSSENTPTRRSLGLRKSKNFLYLFKTGEYLRGVKRLLWVGGAGSKTIRILMLNPAFDEIYLQTRRPEQILDLLARYAKNRPKQLAETF